MSPNEAASIAAMVAIIKEIGTWPAIVVLAMFLLAPWLVMLWVSRGVEKRHAQAVKMYEDNVILVQQHATLAKDYARSVDRWEKITETVLSVVSLNTQAQTRLVETIRNNEFCPELRHQKPVRS
ncbi:hypothetical protein [Desulfobulbus elongatus]|uniref:hypothetical protein n=1 Tax=Desulfobulbus elongatus TaxID=53332 RepID=UPI0004816E6F|nr:hypothetical protein [Desulfobulbus elongatus]